MRAVVYKVITLNGCPFFHYTTATWTLLVIELLMSLRSASCSLAISRVVVGF